MQSIVTILERGVVLFSVASVCLSVRLSVCPSVCLSVRLSVCLSVYNAVTFESLDIKSVFLVWSYIFKICQSNSYIKVIGSTLRSHEQIAFVCKCVHVTVLFSLKIDLECLFLVYITPSYLGQVRTLRSSDQSQGHMSERACLFVLFAGGCAFDWQANIILLLYYYIGWMCVHFLFLVSLYVWSWSQQSKLSEF